MYRKSRTGQKRFSKDWKGTAAIFPSIGRKRAARRKDSNLGFQEAGLSGDVLQRMDALPAC
jgi:hypothetical protein